MNCTGIDDFDDVTTSSSFPAEEDGGLDYTYFPVSLLMIVVSLVANMLVVVITRLVKKLRTASNRYICSLAVADFCVTFSTMLPFMLYNMHGSWPFGAIPCTLWVCCDFSLCTVSMLHLCLIAYDRYTAIARPHSFTKAQRAQRISRHIVITWILGFSVWSPVVIVFRHVMGDADEQEGDCFYLPTRSYVMAQATVVYFLPMLAMVVVYILMMRALKDMDVKWTSPRPAGVRPTSDDSLANTSDSIDSHLPRIPHKGNGKLGGNKLNLAAGTDGIDNGSYIPTDPAAVELSVIKEQTEQVAKRPGVFSIAYRVRDRHLEDSNQQLPADSWSEDDNTTHTVAGATTSHATDAGFTKKKKERAIDIPAWIRRKRRHEALVRMIGLVILVFLICWLPFCVFWPISAFCPTCIPPEVYTMSYWTAYMNSALNPILYFIINSDFRAGLVHLIRRLCQVRLTCPVSIACGCRCH